MQQPSDSLQVLVGKETYGCWLDLLRRIVPDGRTHRIAVVVAAMLQYACHIAFEKYGREPGDGTLAQALLETFDWEEPDEKLLELGPTVQKLFEDAGVKWRRTSKRGQGYSLVDSSILEFIHWHNMPWEN